MDLDVTLREFFAAAVPPPDALARLLRGLEGRPPRPERLAERFRVEASDRGVTRIRLGRGVGAASRGARRHAEHAREELYQYLAGQRTFFTVPLDLEGVPEFQAAVLAQAGRVPFGEVVSYATLAERVGHPRAARAVGTALGRNPVPVIIPCHRIVRGDGTWGHYAFGHAMKTLLLTLERATPVLVGCASTRIVCRRGCAHERRVAEANRVVFASLGDAQSVGYRPCRVCRPALVA